MAEDGILTISDIMKNALDEYTSISYKKDYSDPKLQNSALCATCGGKCCKRCGCFFSPDDFTELTFTALKQELDKGYITIEVVDGDPYFVCGLIFILRTRNIDGPVYESRLVRPSAPCVLLRDDGCSLDWEHRPAGGRLLVPDLGGKCDSSYGIEEVIREWRPYQGLLRELESHYAGREITYYSNDSR